MSDVQPHTEPARAPCAYCRYSHRLRKDGTIGLHQVFYGEKGELCRGSGQPPKRIEATR